MNWDRIEGSWRQFKGILKEGINKKKAAFDLLGEVKVQKQKKESEAEKINPEKEKLRETAEQKKQEIINKRTKRENK